MDVPSKFLLVPPWKLVFAGSITNGVVGGIGGDGIVGDRTVGVGIVGGQF